MENLIGVWLGWATLLFFFFGLVSEISTFLLQGDEGADSLDLKVKDDGTTIEDILVSKYVF